jgi:hypothetical protein
MSFPRGRSGVGLLIARLTVSALLLEIAGNNLLRGDACVISYTVAILSLFVTLGLFVPVVSSLAALLTISLILLVHRETLMVSSAATGFCIVLALVGAGAYSMDARLFGQRRVIWPKR